MSKTFLGHLAKKATKEILETCAIPFMICLLPICWLVGGLSAEYEKFQKLKEKGHVTE